MVKYVLGGTTLNRSILALLLAAGLSAPSGSAGAAPPPALAANVEVTGKMSWTTVRLVKPVLASTAAATVGVSSTGPASVVTVVLAKGVDQPTLVFQRLKFGDRDEWRTFSLGDPEAKDLLPAGTYKLYVLSDQPTTVKVRLGNQPAGTARIKAVSAAKGRAAAVPVTLAGGTQPLPVDESHDTYTAAKPFLVLGVVALNQATKHQFMVQSCTYDSAPPAVTQNCAGGTLHDDDDGGLGPAVPIATPTYELGVRYLWSASPKTLTYGLVYRTTGVPTSAYRWNIWLEL